MRERGDRDEGGARERKKLSERKRSVSSLYCCAGC